MSVDNSEYLLDLDKVVASKFKGKKIPGFVVRWLKKFIHQDFLNSILVAGYDGAEFCSYTLEQMGVEIEVEGLENVPADGTLYTFASNHPLGGVDGIALCSLISQHFGDIRMLVNDFLMFLKPLTPLCVPINKTGGQVRNLPVLVDEAFKSDKQMLIFPAGICSRKINGRIQDLPWTKTFIRKSVQSGRAIVPVHFIGQNSKRFYRVANLCKLLHCKTNFAMFFLPDELYRARNAHFKVIFGKPIPCSHFDKSHTEVEWAAQVRETVYNM